MTQGNSPSTLKPIFRSIEVSTGVPITLGEPLSDAAKELLVPPWEAQQKQYRLKPGSFKDAVEIVIQLTDATVGTDVVQQMSFRYADGTDYKEMVANFEWQIGPPTSQNGGNGNEVSVWLDPNTRFQLVNSAAGIQSMLRDVTPPVGQKEA